MTPAVLIQAAFNLLNVLSPGENLPPELGQSGLLALNGMFGIWRQQALLKPVEVRDVFPLVAGKGSTSNPYTVGLGGDLNIPRIENAGNLTGAGLLLNVSSPPVEIPRAIYTEQMYQAVRIKDLTNALFTGVFYNDTSPLGTLSLWPVPDNAINSLVLYHMQSLGPFATISTSFDLPDGYDEPVIYNLAKRLAAPHGRTLPAEATAIARDSLAIVKRANMPMVDMANPFAVSRGAGYNIQTGQ